MESRVGFGRPSHSFLSPYFRVRLHPIRSVRMHLERTNVFDRAIWPFGLNKPFWAITKHNNE